MERCQEFICVRCIEAADVYGDGQHLYNVSLTDIEIVRCRDCEHKDGWLDGGVQCGVDPDGFCAWAKRRES